MCTRYLLQSSTYVRRVTKFCDSSTKCTYKMCTLQVRVFWQAATTAATKTHTYPTINKFRYFFDKIVDQSLLDCCNSNNTNHNYHKLSTVVSSQFLTTKKIRLHRKLKVSKNLLPQICHCL